MYEIANEDDEIGDGGRIVVCTVLQGCLHRKAPFRFFTREDTASEGMTTNFFS